jgi:hypothetical protein
MPLAVSQEYPSLNDVAPSWADIKTIVNISGGQTVVDIDYKSIKWSSKVERGEQAGASGGRVMKRTTGSVKDEGSCEYYKSGLRKLLKAIVGSTGIYTRGNQQLISLVSFDILIQHSVPGDDEIYEEVMRGCRLSSFESSMAEGNDAEIVPMDLAPMYCAWLIGGKEVVLL